MKNSHYATDNEIKENKEGNKTTAELDILYLDLIDKAINGDFAALQEINNRRMFIEPERLQVLAQILQHNVTVTHKNAPPLINNFAYCLQHGIGIVQSEDQAATYYALAVKKNNTHAMVNLAQLHAERDAILPHQSSLLKKAAKMGNMVAIGKIYDSYQAVELNETISDKDQKKQLKFYKRSAHYGHIPSMLKHASQYLHASSPIFSRRNNRKALKWFEMAANMGNIEAMQMATQLYGGWQGIKADTIKVRKWCEKALNASNNDSLYVYKLLESYLDNRLVPKDYGKAITLLTTRANIYNHKNPNSDSNPYQTELDNLFVTIRKELTPAENAPVPDNLQLQTNILYLLNECNLPLNALNNSGGDTIISIIKKHDPVFAASLEEKYTNIIQQQAAEFGQYIAKHPAIDPKFPFPGDSPGLLTEIGGFLFGNRHLEEKNQVTAFETTALTRIKETLKSPNNSQEEPAKLTQDAQPQQPVITSPRIYVGCQPPAQNTWAEREEKESKDSKEPNSTRIASLGNRRW